MAANCFLGIYKIRRFQCEVPSPCAKRARKGEATGGEKKNTRKKGILAAVYKTCGEFSAHNPAMPTTVHERRIAALLKLVATLKQESVDVPDNLLEFQRADFASRKVLIDTIWRKGRWMVFIWSLVGGREGCLRS